MKKVFDQTVRDLKREVNKKVLKVPGIEQKVLDATSNEPWGPHGSHLADIAQATRNYHEYQMIMTVIWKRINDTGKNWRHVYKALTILEYLVAHGSERVADEIREHAYQISTLSNFQYIDSGGRDQGSNVRRKSQSLVTLVNDKERIQEVRQKAHANRDKNRSTGSPYGPSTGGYGDRYDDQPEGRSGYKDDDRENHEKGRDYGYRDDDRYGRGGDKYSRDGDRYGKDYEERYGRDGYRDDDYRGHGNDDYRVGSRRSVDRYTDRSFDDDDRYSSRSGGGRADDHSQDDRRLERQLSGHNVGAPPSYEEATSDAQNHIQNERDGGIVASPAHKSSLPPVPKAASPSKSTSEGPDNVSNVSPTAPNQEFDAFDEFDPRGSVSAAPPAAHSPELDFFGSLSASDSTNSLALLPVSPVTATFAADMPTNSGFGTNFAAPPAAHSPELDFFGSLSASDSTNSLALLPVSPATATFAADMPTNSGFGTNFAAPSSSTVLNQANENPFGDSPFKAIPQENFPAQPQNYPPATSIHPSGSTGSTEPFPPVTSKVETVPDFDFGDTLGGLTYAPTAADGQHSSANPGFSAPEFPVALTSSDVLADIFPETGTTDLVYSQTARPAAPTDLQTAQMNLLPQSAMFPPQEAQPAGPNNMHPSYLNILQQQGSPAPLPSQASSSIYSQAAQPGAPSNMQFAHLNHLQQPGMSPSVSLAAPISSQAIQAAAQNNMQPAQSNLFQEPGLSVPQASHTTSAGPPAKARPSKEKFEPKSAVWTDTLSRGLVDLNISGAKINPLADIGIDFDAINRREKRKEVKSSAAPVTSTITMGKAMGSGSGIGRATASGLAHPPNPIMGMGMGMGGGPGMGMGMSGYGGSMNQPPMGMGMGPAGMGMNVGMGMGQGFPMQPPPTNGMPPPGPGMSGVVAYNPMMGMSNYGPPPQQPHGGGPQQQPYGGGYR